MWFFKPKVFPIFQTYQDFIQILPMGSQLIKKMVKKLTVKLLND